MRIVSIPLITCLFVLAPAAAHSNAIPPMPLDVQLARADLVVVARLGERTNCAIGGACAEILPEVIVKGAAASPGVRRYLILSSNISELSIDHITVPASTLLFMNRWHRERTTSLDNDDEFYRPVLGFRSVVALNFTNVTDVQRAMCPLRPVAAPLRSAAEISAC